MLKAAHFQLCETTLDDTCWLLLVLYCATAAAAASTSGSSSVAAHMRDILPPLVAQRSTTNAYDAPCLPCLQAAIVSLALSAHSHRCVAGPGRNCPCPTKGEILTGIEDPRGTNCRLSSRRSGVTQTETRVWDIKKHTIESQAVLRITGQVDADCYTHAVPLQQKP
jgi:hypothetical protein